MFQISMLTGCATQEGHHPAMICLCPSQQFRQVADLDPNWQNTVKAVKLIRSYSDPFTPYLDLLGEFCDSPWGLAQGPRASRPTFKCTAWQDGFCSDHACLWTLSDLFGPIWTWVLRPVGSNWIFILTFRPKDLNGYLLANMCVWEGSNSQLLRLWFHFIAIALNGR